MRVVFVDNLLFEDTEGIRRYVLQPHLGLISLISILEAGGHEGLLLDPKVPVAQGKWRLDDSLYRKIADEILALSPDTVGMTSLGCNFICTVKVASYLKEMRPDLPIMLGGPHASVLDKVIMARFPQFDVIARQEAERNIVPLVESLAKGSLWKVPGITFRVKGALWENPAEPVIDDLDSLPIPAYHRYPIRELGLTSLRVDAGRGCPFQCTFCSTASFFGRKYRLKSAERLVEELDFLHSEYGVSDFALTHDLFTVNRHKVKEFCNAVEGRGFTWKCSARMDCVDEELLERMAAAGCRSIYYGIEAGTARMQNISKKRLDLGLFNPILDITQRLGMSSTASFITGYPEETHEDQNATLDMIASCFDRRRSPLNVQLHLLTPEPGTELLSQYKEQIAYDGHVSDFNFPNLEGDDGEVIQRNADVFINHHYFPSIVARRRHIFVTQVYQALYALGFPLLQYMLRFFEEQRFSAALESMYEWYEGESWKREIDNCFLESYFTARYGRKHHLTGMVIYMCRASELRRVTTNQDHSRGSEFDVNWSYCLSSHARLVRSVPDCPRLLEALDARRGSRAKAPANLCRVRYHFLLQRLPGSHDIVQNYVLTEASLAALDMFSIPHSVAEFRSMFPEKTGFPPPPVEFLKVLFTRGVLETALPQTRPASV